MRRMKSGLCLSLVGLLACLGWPYGRSDGLRSELAVVERERLWKCHGSYRQLEQLDEELGRLQTEKLSLLNRAQVRCDQLFQEEQARRLWNLEHHQMQAQIEQASRQFQTQAEQEMKALHARFERQIEALRMPNQDLQVMASAAVTRFRLEKQKEVGVRLQARRRQLDEQVAHFEEDLSRQFQAEKVDLQVGLQLREDETARRRLAAIADELEVRLAERRQLAETEMRDYTTIEEGQLALELRDYERGLRKELLPAGPDLAALKQKEQRQLQSVRKIHQARLIEVARELEARARQRFEKQLSGLRGRHERAGEELPEAFLEPGERARLEKLAELIAQARRRRDKAQGRLLGGISGVVGEQAQKRGLESVIMDVRLNLQLQDLTDVSLAGVAELSR